MAIGIPCKSVLIASRKPDYPRLDEKDGLQGDSVVDFAPSKVVRMGIN
jgi:hypothetical protein